MKRSKYKSLKKLTQFEIKQNKILNNIADILSVPKMTTRREWIRGNNLGGSGYWDSHGERNYYANHWFRASLLMTGIANKYSFNGSGIVRSLCEDHSNNSNAMIALAIITKSIKTINAQYELHQFPECTK